MKLALKAFTIFLLNFSYTFAQENSLLERLNETKAVASAHDRANTHIVIISGHFDPIHHMNPDNPSPASNTVFEKTCFIQDLTKFLEQEVELAREQQGVAKPSVVILTSHIDIGLQETLISDGKNYQGLGRTVKAALRNLQDKAKLEVVEYRQESMYPDAKDTTNRAWLEGVQFLNQTIEGATFSLHVMENNLPGLRTQMDFLIAQDIFELGERARMNIRISGKGVMSEVVVPSSLLALYPLIDGKKINITIGSRPNLTGKGLGLTHPQTMSLQEFANLQTNIKTGKTGAPYRIPNWLISSNFRSTTNGSLVQEWTQAAEVAFKILNQSVGHLDPRGRNAGYEQRVELAMLYRQASLLNMATLMEQAQMDQKASAIYREQITTFFDLDQPVREDLAAPILEALTEKVGPAEMTENLREVRQVLKPVKIKVKGK